MDSLEQLLNDQNARPSRPLLANGDEILAVVRSAEQEELKGKAFFFTGQGDIFYVDEEGEGKQVYQAAYKRKKGMLVDDRFLVRNANKDRLPMGYGPSGSEKVMKRAIESLETIARATRRKGFLPEETAWFSTQLQEYAQESVEGGAKVPEKEILERLSRYVPTSGTVSLFGRGAAGKEVVRTVDKDYRALLKRTGYTLEGVFKENEQKSIGVVEYLLARMDIQQKRAEEVAAETTMSVGIDELESEFLAGVAARLSGKEFDRQGDDSTEKGRIQAMLTKIQKEDIGKFAEDVLSRYVLSKKFPTGKRIQDELKDHGVDLGLAEPTPKAWRHYDPKVKNGKGGVFLETGKERMLISIEKGAPISYAREAFVEERTKLAGRIGTAYHVVQKDLGGALRGFGKRIGKAKDHLRHNLVVYALAAGIALGGSGGYLIRGQQDRARDGSEQRDRTQQETTGQRDRAQNDDLEQKVQEYQEKETENTGKNADYLQEAARLAEEQKTATQLPTSYTVKSGDCLWNIAKGTLPDSVRMDNAAVLTETDRLAAENGKLTIRDYTQAKADGKSVAKQVDPNYILPGQELKMPGKEYQKKEETKKEATAPEKRGTNYEGQQKRSDKYVIPPLVMPLLTPQDATKNSSGYTLKNIYRKELPLKGAALEERVAPMRKGDMVQQSQKFGYLDVLAEMATMRAQGAGLSELRAKYDGFRDDAGVIKALQDYQGYVQSGMMQGYLGSYDRRIASDSLKARIVHEYRTNPGSLREVREALRKEYGMDISQSTISKYSREMLSVKSRKEAREKPKKG
jgi:LysM repeat protein